MFADPRDIVGQLCLIGPSLDLSLQILTASQWGTRSGRFNTGKNSNISDNITFTLLILLNSTGKTSSMTVLKITSLGEIRGRDNNSATQYPGIKYAILRNQLADAELVKSREGEVLDAVKDG